MDLSIWDPPENQDESSYPTNSWKYNLYFDPRLDVIEEDALNEKSCKQVLKILTNKADSEIVELEDDILMVHRQLACEDYMDFAALNKKTINLESMLKALKNENQQPAEPGVGSSNLPEGLTKTKAIDDDNTKDIKTVKFRAGCTVQDNNKVLASLVEVKNQQETPAGTTLEDRHASEQKIKEYISKSTQNGVKSVQIYDPSGMKGQEVLHTEIDRTIEDTRPHLLNSIRNDRSTLGNKLKSEGDDYGDKTIKGTQQLAGAKRTGGFADISPTSQSHLRKRCETSFSVPVFQVNNDQRNVQNVLVKSHGRTSQEPRILYSVHNVDVVFPMPSITPVPCVATPPPPPTFLAYIDNMSLVQLKALANQHNIYGVSKTRKAELQQLLRSKLQHKYWS